MSKLALIAAIALGLCLVFVLMLIKRAPEGHEDEEGFHHGAPSQPTAPKSASEEKRSAASADAKPR